MKNQTEPTSDLIDENADNDAPITSNKENNQELKELFNLVGSIAAGLKNAIVYLLIAGAGAIVFLAWKWIDFSTSFTWIAFKVTPFLIPLGLWAFLYFIIAELAELPERVNTAKRDGSNAVNAIQSRKEIAPQEPKGFFAKLRGLFRALRSAGNLAAIVEAVGGAVVIANPLFAFLFFLSGVLLSLFAFVALLIILF